MIAKKLMKLNKNNYRHLTENKVEGINQDQYLPQQSRTKIIKKLGN